MPQLHFRHPQYISWHFHLCELPPHVLLLLFLHCYFRTRKQTIKHSLTIISCYKSACPTVALPSDVADGIASACAGNGGGGGGGGATVTGTAAASTSAAASKVSSALNSVLSITPAPTGTGVGATSATAAAGATSTSSKAGGVGLSVGSVGVGGVLGALLGALALL